MLTAPPGRWYGVACSADGKRIYAVEATGFGMTSPDAGLTWTYLNLPQQPWSGVTCSTDGSEVIATAGTFSTGPLLVSPDAGKTWEFAAVTNAHWMGAHCPGRSLKLFAFQGGLSPGRIFAGQRTPALSIAHTSGQLVISWSAKATGFVLQHSTDLQANNWTDVTEPPMQAEDQHQVSTAFSGGSHFFRLRSE